MRLISAIAGLGLFVSAAHADLTGTDAYGVYIQSSSGYVLAERNDSFYNLNFDASALMMTMPVLERENDTLEIVVHHPDFHPDLFEMDVRPVGLASARNVQQPIVTPLGDDRYSVNLSDSVADGQVILMNLSCCFNGVHGAVLGDPVEAVKMAFDKGADLNPAGAEQLLSRISRAVPDNEELAALHEYWEIRLAQREATRQFEFVENVWTQYENAEGSEARIEALQRVRSVTESYLSSHPNGLEREAVQLMHDQSVERLDI